MTTYALLNMFGGEVVYIAGPAGKPEPDKLYDSTRIVFLNNNADDEKVKSYKKHVMLNPGQCRTVCVSNCDDPPPMPFPAHECLLLQRGAKFTRQYWEESGAADITLYDAKRYKGAHPKGYYLEPGNVLNKMLGTRPLTGVLAVWLALMGGAKCVYVSGFTFYQDGDEFPQQRGSHDVLKNMIGLSQLEEWYSGTLIFDDFLREHLTGFHRRSK